MPDRLASLKQGLHVAGGGSQSETKPCVHHATHLLGCSSLIRAAAKVAF